MPKVYEGAKKGASREEMFENIKQNEATMRQREYNIRYRTKSLEDPTDQIKGAYGERRYNYKLSDMKDPDYTYSDREIYNYSKRLAKDLNEGVGLFKKTNVQGVEVFEPKMGELESISEGLQDYNKQIRQIDEQVEKRLEFKKMVEASKDEYGLYLKERELARMRKAINKAKNTGKTVEQIKNERLYPGEITAPKIVNPTERANQILRLANAESGNFTPRQKMEQYKKNYLKALNARISEMMSLQDADAVIELTELREKIDMLSLEDFATMYHLDVLANPDEWYKEVTATKIITNIKTSFDVYKGLKKKYRQQYGESLTIKYPMGKLSKTVRQYAEENKKVLEKFGTIKLKKL